MNKRTLKGTRIIVGSCSVLFVLTAVLAASRIAPLGPGSLDPTFALDGKVTTDFGLNEDSQDTAVQPDGKIIVVGLTGANFGSVGDFALARYNPDGGLDLSFDGDGKVTTDFLSFRDRAHAVVIQPDRKIVVAGEASSSADGDSGLFAVARYNIDGSLDNSFDGDGKVTADLTPSFDIAFDLVIQPDGKLVVVGSASNAAGLIRYNPDGSIDTSFRTTGNVVTNLSNRFGGANGVGLQPDGKIVIGGTGGIGTGEVGDDFAVARFNSNGEPDTTFGVGGVVITDMSQNDDSGRDIALQPDGKIVIAGHAGYFPGHFGLARYNSDGSLDEAFGTKGRVITEFDTEVSKANAVTIEPDGKIVTVGEVSVGHGLSSDFALTRHHSNGDPDTSFGIGGRVTTDYGGYERVAGVALEADGKIIAVGVSAVNEVSDFAVARYLSSGVNSAKPFDYDGDGRTDISVFRPFSGDWYLQRSSAGFFGQNFGWAEDRIAPADYDGDGKTDVALYRPSNGVWYIANSSNGTFTVYPFGIAEDVPVSADYDGDGKADISVFRPSTGTWHRQNSSDGSFFATQFGMNGDKPTVGDFDGDGKADVAVFRPSTGAWYQALSSNGTFFGEQFGIVTDRITPADYDGDGRTDIAIYRPTEGLWYVKNSAISTYIPYLFGIAEDIPVAGDFDGDGKADIAVFRPSDGTWYIVNSSNSSYTIHQFGQNGDQPTQNAFNN